MTNVYRISDYLVILLEQFPASSMNIYFLITLKRYIEQIIMYPFVLLGKVLAILKPLEAEYDFFVFFPIYGIGGAEKINADVITSLPDKKIIIFFTRNSPDDKLRHLFQKENVTIKEIDRWTDNKFMYWGNLIYRGICAQYINSQKKQPVVFSGQCNFGYKLFPHLRKDILKTELIHNSFLKFAKVTFPYIPFIDKRVMTTQSIIDQHLQYYRERGIPEKYESRIVKITSCIFVPDQYTQKKNNGILKLYYAGRGGYQKHLELLFEIMSICLDEKLPVEFHLAGTFEDEIPAQLKPRIVWHGSIGSSTEMYKLHADMDVLVMTSRFEGFPVAIQEAMSCGVAIICTNVNGLPEHITDSVNGFLMHRLTDEEIVTDGVSYIKTLLYDRNLLETISRNNYEYAKEHFTKSTFDRAFRSAFELKEPAS
jgi:L-malate glycosyltransferase